MKKVDLSQVDEDKKRYYEYESIFLKRLLHPNICRLFSSFRENSNIYMIKLSEAGVNNKVVTDVLKRGYLKIIKMSEKSEPIAGTVFRLPWHGGSWNIRT